MFFERRCCIIIFPIESEEVNINFVKNKFDFYLSVLALENLAYFWLSNDDHL